MRWGKAHDTTGHSMMLARGLEPGLQIRYGVTRKAEVLNMTSVASPPSALCGWDILDPLNFIELYSFLMTLNFKNTFF